jgi:hypothetical protein
VASRAFRWGFVAVTVALGGYAVAAQWGQVSRSLDRMGPLTVALALISVLLGALMSMQVWRALLASLGSPLPVPGTARILFLGQLGKYLPGSVWPVLAQMELGKTYRVPRHRSASASVLVMLLSLLTGLLTALVMPPFTGTSSYLWAFAVTPVLLACLHPRVLNKLMSRLLGLARQPPLEHPLSGRTLAVALGWSFAVWNLQRGADLAAHDKAGRAHRQQPAARHRRVRVRVVGGLHRGIRPRRRGPPRGYAGHNA